MSNKEWFWCECRLCGHNGAVACEIDPKQGNRVICLKCGEEYYDDNPKEIEK